MDRRLTKPLAVLAIIVALVLGLVVGVTTGLADRLFGSPKPETIASASLESMRAQNRLIVFAARYVSVTTSTTDRLGFTARRTLILPGDVRYELDLARLEPKDLAWDSSTRTLRVQLPEIEIAGPDVDLASAQEYGAGGVLSALTNADERLDQANRAKAVQNLREQAGGAVPMRLARQAARAAIERSFAMPLAAAGFRDVKVVARFPTDGTDEPSYLDLSTPYEQAIEEAKRRRAAEGQK
ncbi:MAG TPA: DUF4230 domain-containing protein [Sphingomicrobium sp.]|nr:DUF4230 domain-containing protein [Sphingomicrobium sp.]